ncbi:hypothetical protein [Kribbella deserti]|uniref:MFS transporter n=1 Tax=Kribbella deserti TaxID=1926257 RepID=A0ABV6QN40_9ACTN
MPAGLHGEQRKQHSAFTLIFIISSLFAGAATILLGKRMPAETAFATRATDESGGFSEVFGEPTADE